MEKLNIDISSIVSSIDTEDLANEHLWNQGQGYDYDDDFRAQQSVFSSPDDIDAIFER